MKLRKVKSKEKKGDIFQLLFILIIVFIAAIVGFLFLGMTNRVNQFWLNSGILNNSETAVTAQQTLNATAPTTTDYMIFFLFLGSTIGVCVSAVRTNFSPTIVFMFLLLLIITIFVASGIVNVYQGFQGALPDVSAQLTLTNLIFSKYTPLIMAVIGGMILIIMYGKQGADIVT